MHKDFNVSAKAVDDDDIKLNYKSLRGNGGIAVFWKKTIASTLRIHNVAVWLLFGQVPFLRENYVATTYFRYVICKSL
jgi:hypothetical protein